MAFVIEIKGEVFGSCVEGIDVYVEVECGGVWLCCRRKYLRFIFVEKRLKIGSGDG